MSKKNTRTGPSTLLFTVVLGLRKSAIAFLSGALPLVLLAGPSLANSSQADSFELSNGSVLLDLDTNDEGLPIISQAVWADTDQQIFREVDLSASLADWVPAELIPSRGETAIWRITEDDNFIRAQASLPLLRGLIITWVVELAWQGSLMRLHVRIENAGDQAQEIKWFPVWSGTWSPGGGATWLRSWRALEFTPFEAGLNDGQAIELSSRLHSSDEQGYNPYWIIGGGDTWLHFGLEWCGGWEVKVRPNADRFQFSARLPPRETQLELEPGESIEGPAVIVVPTRGGDRMSHRYDWMTQRLALGRTLHGGPSPSFPLTYNNWYAVRWDVNAAFLKRQLGVMAPFQFDHFIIDAGWFIRAGMWEPDSTKFAPGEFQEITSDIRAKGVNPGMWTCPQYISAPGDDPPLEADEPASFFGKVGGYLADLDGSNFTSSLTSHVTAMRERYGIGWWKYDKDLFIEQSRAGVMKNVVAYQDALRAVRQANPDLFIEGCFNGGRMINELTVGTSQTLWVRDADDARSLEHAFQNLAVGLGALEFIFPWQIHQWTILLDRLGQSDPEFLRFYCRTAMMGTWGLSTDLAEISPAQQSIILKEIRRYRHLNAIKQHGLYELIDRGDIRGVAFYDREQRRAGVLLYRPGGGVGGGSRIAIRGLDQSLRYKLADVDLDTAVIINGSKLNKKGVVVNFPPGRQSALLFIYPDR